VETALAFNATLNQTLPAKSGHDYFLPAKSVYDSYLHPNTMQYDET